MSPRRPLPAPSHYLVRLGEDAGRQVLLVDGVVQSISPHDGQADGGYWAAMVPPARPRRALILGFGGGTLARLLLDRWGHDVHILGIDDDVAVLETARAAGWLDVPETTVEIVDAFAFVRQCRQRFDYIAVDLYRADTFVGRSLTKPVLQRLRQLLEPGGWLAVNLFLDAYLPRRIARIAAVFDVDSRIPVGGNLVVRARR